MNVQSLWRRFRQVLSGGRRSPRRRPRPPAPALRILRLERRRVLSADFSFGASGLILHGFDADGGETLSISQAETEYRFTLNNGDWSTPAGPSPDGVRLDGQTLAIESALVDQLVDGLTVIGDAMTPLDVSLDQADFSAFQGPLSFTGIRSINQAANTQLAFGEASSLEIMAAQTGMTIGSLNVAGDLTITTFGPITDGDGTQINVTGNATFISRAFHPAADFDADGMVGPSDYGIWSANFGLTVGATKEQGDADGDGAVNISDYTAWRDALGQVSEPGGIFLADHLTDQLNVGGQATFEAQDGATRYDIEVGALGTTNFGSLAVIGANAYVQEDSSSDLVEVDSNTLTLISAGAITDAPGTTINVTGLAAFDAGANPITLGDDAGDSTNFGQLQLTGGAVSVMEDSSTELTDVTATTLTLTSAGAITDASTINVVGNATFNAGGAITLNENAGDVLSVGGLATFRAGTVAPFFDIMIGPSGMANFGSLHLTGDDITVQEDSATVLTHVTATTLALTSDGSITDAAGTTINVTGLATFNAGANPITLGDSVGDTTNFGQLRVTGGAVTITEDSGTELTGVTAAALAIISAGPITDAPGTAISVTGLAALNAGANPITLGNNATDTTDFGQLQLTGGAVAITEDSGTELTGVVAGSLNLTSAGAITDAAGTSISVTGLATLHAGANPITLGNNAADTTNFGQLHVTGGAVSITEDSGTELTGVNTASLALTSAGTITDAVGTTISVTGLATLNAGANSIMLGDNAADTTNFGQLNLTGGAVTVTEDSGTHLTGVNAATLGLVSTGPISDAAGASISVSDLARLDAGANPITLGDNAADTVNFGQLHVTGGAVAITEDSATVLTGVTATTLNLTSAGSITDAAGTAISVTGRATLNAGANPVTLGDNAGDVTNFGQLSVTGGAVSVAEDSGTELTGVNAASLSLTSAGAITDAAGTTISVSGEGRFNAGANLIALGDSAADVTNFGRLHLTGGMVTVTEDSATELTGVTAAVLHLTSAGALTDAAGTTINVADDATFRSEGAITLADNALDVLSVGDLASLRAGEVAPFFNIIVGPAGAVNFGQLHVTGAAVSVQEDSATVLIRVTANTLYLQSAGSITDTAATTIGVTGLATLNAGANAITLGDSVGDTTNFGQLHLTGGAVAITEDSGTLLTGVLANTLNLFSAGPITDALATNISVTGLATLHAGANPITLGDSAGDTTNFGQLHLTGGAIAITEDSATVLMHVTANSLTLVSAGSITDVLGTLIDVNGTATFNSGGAIVLADNATDVLSVDQLATFRAGTVAPFFDITIGPAGMANFGSLHLTGKVVSVQEDSATEITGVTATNSFSLNSAGAITDTAAAIIFVDGPATIIADGKITLADHNVVGTANSVIVTSLGSFQVTDGNNIDIGVIVPSGLPAAANAQLGSLQFTAIGGLVRVALDGPIILSGESAGGSAWLNAEGSITDAFGANTTITQFAILEAAAGSDIVLGDDSEFYMATSEAPLAAFDQSRFLAMQAENVSIQVDSGFNLSTSSNYNEFAGTVFLSAQGNITQVSHEGDIAPLDANRIAVFGAGAILFSQVRLKGQVTTDGPNLAIHGGAPLPISILSEEFPVDLIPGSATSVFSPIGFDPAQPDSSGSYNPAGARIIEASAIGDGYSIIMKVLGDAKVGVVQDATGVQDPLVGIEVTNPSGNAYLQATPDPDSEPEAGNIVFTSVGVSNEVIVHMLGGVFTAIAAGKLTIDTDQPDAATGARTTKLTSSTGTVTSVEAFLTFDGATGATVNATGPRFVLDLPSQDQNAATTGLVFSPEFEQRVTLAAGSRGEDGILIELEWADVQNRRDGRPSLPADFPGSNPLPTITLVPQSVDGLAPEPLLQSSEPPLSFRVVTSRHNYSEAFIPKNPFLPQLPTTVRLYNDPAINLFDQFDGTDFRDLNSNSTFVSPRAVAVPTAGYFEITSAELPTTFDPPEPIVATAVTTVPQQLAVVDEIRVSASSDTETIRFGRVGEDGEFINEPGEEWPVEWQGGRDGDFLNEIREAVENSPSLEGLYRIESQTPRGEQPLEEFRKEDVNEEIDLNDEDPEAAESAEAVDEQPPQEEVNAPGASVTPPAEQVGIGATARTTSATEYRLQRGASHLASGQLLVGAAALAVCRWNHRLAANGPLEPREARADLSRAARRRRAWRNLRSVPTESDSEVAG